MKTTASTQWYFAVLPIALLAQIGLATLAPAVAAQDKGSSPNSATSESSYTESKFELATTDPVRDTLFYSELGFRVVAKTSYGYVTLKSGPVVIALSPTTGIGSHDISSLSAVRRPPVGVEIVLYTSENLDAKRARLVSLGLKPTEIKLQPWGVRDFRITDPGGYYIRISEGTPVPSK